MNYSKLQETWIENLIKKYSHRFVPSLYVFAFDVGVVFVAFFIAYIIRLNFGFDQLDMATVTNQAIFVTFFYAVSFRIFRSYSSIIRHTSYNDALKVFHTNVTAFLFIVLISYLLHAINLHSFHIPLGVSIIHFLLCCFILLGARVIVKSVYYIITGTEKKARKNVLIYGAGSSGMLTRNALIQDKQISYHITAFIDENPGKIGKRLEGIKIHAPSYALRKDFIDRASISQLIIAVQGIRPVQRKEIIESALELNLEVKVVPSIDTWINGQLSSEQINKVNIEDLLQREQIEMGTSHISKYLYGKVILISGAAGSIGSGIVKKVLPFRPAKIILLDQAESALYDLQFEINNDPLLKEYSHLAEYVVANIKDRFRLDQIFNEHKPEILYHAAAYKHVPLMEQNPYEALLVNVFGTKSLADLAIKYKIEKFVMVSTDKAVNPTNIMGASKRIAEIYTQGMSNGITQFITTRFGNVLDSNGSVVPIFRKQIESGGPITITHKDITRYFMSIPEACSLILEAGAMGKGGEIFVFDMGEPIKIFELAKKMIKLSGLEPDVDINIKEVGLRPGEKLFEELLSSQEDNLPTYHPKILRGKVRQYEKGFVDTNLDDLANIILDSNPFDIVAKMKEIVPEYISNNSIYSSLDKQKVQ